MSSSKGGPRRPPSGRQASGRPQPGARPKRPPQRPAVGRGQGASRAPQRVTSRSLGRAWWQQPWVIPTSAVTVVALVVVVVLASRGGAGSQNGTLPAGTKSSPAPASIASAVTSVPESTFNAVSDGGIAQPFKAASGQSPLKGSDGKPVFLYVGADYCPFCAAERWSIVLALSRFGQVSGLELTTSSSTDVDPETNTFTFANLKVTSSILDVQAVELQDRTSQPLQTPNATQAAAFSALDQPPYMGTQGGIPFVDIGNRFVGGLGSGYGPDNLQGFTWDQIAQKLGNPNDPVTRGIVGNANRITAAICAVTNNQPASVCQTQVMQRLVGQLPTS